MTLSKKSLLAIPVLLVMVFSMIMLSACGKQMKFEVNDNLNTTVEATISLIKTNAYNNSTLLGTETTYSASEIKAKIPTLEYYVKVGKVSNVDKVESITLNETKFTDAQTFKLSIGNSNFIEDKCFYVEEDNLYISAPILAVESIGLNKIKINDKSFDYNQTTTAQEFAFTNVAFKSGSASTATKVTGTTNEYELNIKDGTTWVGLYYANAVSTDYALTKKVLTTGTNTSVAYGFTAVENATDYPIALYPIGWKPSYDGTATGYSSDSVMDYTVYIPGKGVAKVVLNYNLIAPSAE